MLLQGLKKIKEHVLVGVDDFGLVDDRLLQRSNLLMDGVDFSFDVWVNQRPVVGVLNAHRLIMNDCLSERKLKALAIVGLLIAKGLLFWSPGLTDLDVLQFDCPFLILHTFIMNASTGTFNRKVSEELKNKKDSPDTHYCNRAEK